MWVPLIHKILPFNSTATRVINIIAVSITCWGAGASAPQKEAPSCSSDVLPSPLTHALGFVATTQGGVKQRLVFSCCQILSPSRKSLHTPTVPVSMFLFSQNRARKSGVSFLNLYQYSSKNKLNWKGSWLCGSGRCHIYGYFFLT